MIAKSELQDVLERMRAEERGARGEPPSVEEMLAYRSGELSADGEERVREQLTCWPELLRALMSPLPEDDAKPGDADYLPPELIERQLSALHEAVGGGGGRVVRFPHLLAAIAAALALVFGGLFLQARQQLRQPRALSAVQELRSGNVRGPEPPVTTLAGTGDAYLLQATPISEQRFEKYAFELEEASGRKLWTSREIADGDDRTFSVVVPRAFLQPGEYTLVLYGINGERRERIDSYIVRVPRR